MDLPPFLEGKVALKSYARWLKYRAIAHSKRDCKRGNTTATARAYQAAIHSAVVSSGGLCHYTGEDLDWSRISTYNNEESKKGRRTYKAGFAKLPSVDHVGDGLSTPDFVICGWAVNDAKGDLNLADFLALCKKVLKHRGACLDGAAA